MARTIMPGNVDALFLRLAFVSAETPPHATPEVLTHDTLSSLVTGSIPAGDWNVTITGYLTATARTDNQPVGTFVYNDFTVNPSPATNTLNATLSPIFDAGTGTFTWAIGGPGSGTISVGSYTEPSDSGSVTLPAGDHTVTLALTYGTRSLTITSALQIFQNMTSNWAMDVTEAMFLRPIEDVILGSRRVGAWNLVADGLTYAHFALIGINGLAGIENDVIQTAFNTFSATATTPLAGPYEMGRLQQLVDAMLVSRAPGSILDPPSPHANHAAAELLIIPLPENSTVIEPTYVGPPPSGHFTWTATAPYTATVAVGVYSVPLTFAATAFPPAVETGTITVNITIGDFMFVNAAAGATLGPLSISYLALRTASIPVTLGGGGTSWSINGVAGGAYLTSTLVGGLGTVPITVYMTGATGRDYSVTVNLIVNP